MYVGHRLACPDRGVVPHATASGYTQPAAARARSVAAAGDFIEGEVADPGNPPPGCAFHPRCPFVQDRCRSQVPELRQLEGKRRVSCHRAEELDLA